MKDLLTLTILVLDPRYMYRDSVTGALIQISSFFDSPDLYLSEKGFCRPLILIFGRFFWVKFIKRLAARFCQQYSMHFNRPMFSSLTSK